MIYSDEKWDVNGIWYPLVICYIAIENGHRKYIVDLPINIVIFHSYVSLPEGHACFEYMFKKTNDNDNDNIV